MPSSFKNFFDFLSFSGSHSAKSGRSVARRKNRRTLRVEELESREMLDAGLMTALADVFAAHSPPTQTVVQAAYFADSDADSNKTEHSTDEATWAGAPVAEANSGGNAVTITWEGETLPPNSIFQYKKVADTEWTTYLGMISEDRIQVVGLATGAYDFRMLDQGNEVNLGVGIEVEPSSEPTLFPQRPKFSVGKGADKPTVNSVTLFITPHKNATAESNVRYTIDLVQMGKNKNPNFTPITVTAEYLALQEGTMVIDGLTQGQSYKFSVTALNAVGYSSSGKSNAKDVVVTKSVKTPKFSAVQKLKLDRYTIPPKGVRVSMAAFTWMPSKASLPEGADVRYEILMYEGKSKTPSPLPPAPDGLPMKVTMAPIGTGGMMGKVEGLTPETKYKFAVREVITINGIDISALDAKISFKTLRLR